MALFLNIEYSLAKSVPGPLPKRPLLQRWPVLDASSLLVLIEQDVMDYVYIAGIIDMFCLCYCLLCVLYTLAYVWGNDHVDSCLHIHFFIECRPHIRQHIHLTQKVGTFVEQISDFSCVGVIRAE